MEEYGEAKYLSIIIFAVDTAFLDVNLSEQEKQKVCQSLCQGPLSMGVFQARNWSGLPFPSPGDLLDLGIKPESPALQEDSLPPVKAKLKNNKKICTTLKQNQLILCHVQQRTDIKIRDNAQRQRVFYAWFQQQWEIRHNSVPAFKTQQYGGTID